MFKSKAIRISTLLLAISFLSACGSGTDDPDNTGNTGEAVENQEIVEISEPAVDNEPMAAPDFEIRSNTPNYLLVEGNPDGVTIPLTLSRSNGHDLPISLEIRGVTDEDVAFITTSPSPLTLSVNESESQVTLNLAIGDVPIQNQNREFVIVASDGSETSTFPVSVSVQPTSAPDVYLLAGQSNMVGFSGDNTRESEPGGLDEPNERIKQLNVSENNENTVFVTDADYTSFDTNVDDPIISTALDPLHLPFDPDSEDGKDESYIGLGLSFAKRAISDTTADVVLVPAAWSGSSFCAENDLPPGNWMPAPSDDENLGNTLIFDRAVTRANIALEQTGGVLRGILWHQGESDAFDNCAPQYQQNLQDLAQALRDQVKTVGNDNLLRAADSTIPFVVGTMSRGADDRGDLSEYLDAKQTIDNVHRNVSSLIENSEVSIHDDLTPANGYPCGNSSCIHFGPGALREMGSRYYDAMLLAIAQ